MSRAFLTNRALLGGWGRIVAKQLDANANFHQQSAPSEQVEADELIQQPTKHFLRPVIIFSLIVLSIIVSFFLVRLNVAKRNIFNTADDALSSA